VQGCADLWLFFESKRGLPAKMFGINKTCSTLSWYVCVCVCVCIYIYIYIYFQKSLGNPVQGCYTVSLGKK
jgi:hypothetical protein